MKRSMTTKSAAEAGIAHLEFFSIAARPAHAAHATPLHAQSAMLTSTAAAGAIPEKRAITPGHQALAPALNANPASQPRANALRGLTDPIASKRGVKAIHTVQDAARKGVT